MNTKHTVEGIIDNAMNITEAISMLTSKYRNITGLTVVYKEDTTTVDGEFMNDYVTKKYYRFTLMYEEELC